MNLEHHRCKFGLGYRLITHLYCEPSSHTPMLKIPSPIALAMLFWFVAAASGVQAAEIPTDAPAISIPVESLPQAEELTRMERRLARAACRALESGVLADVLVERVEKSLVNRGVQGDVLALTTGFVGEALSISTDELCLVR